MKKNGTRRAVKQEKKAWERPVSFRPTASDREMLDDLTEALGSTDADMLRRALQAYYADMVPAEYALGVLAKALVEMDCAIKLMRKRGQDAGSLQDMYDEVVISLQQMKPHFHQ